MTPGGAAPSSLRLPAVQGGAFPMRTAPLGAGKAQRPALRRLAPFEASERRGIMRAPALNGEAMAPPPPAPEKAAMLRWLPSASGAGFGRMSVMAQVQGHREALQVHAAIQGSGAAPAADRTIALPAIDRIRGPLADPDAVSARA